MTRPQRLILCCVLFAPTWGHAQTQPADDARAPMFDGSSKRSHRLVSGGRVLWLIESRDEGNGVALVRLSYWRTSGVDGEGFKPALAAPLAGRVAFAAASDTALHLFFYDGSHRRFNVPARSWPPVQEKLYRSELVLPDSALPAAMAVDASSAIVFVVTTRDRASALTAITPLPLGEDDLYPQVTPPPSEDAPVPQTPWSLVRYEGARWRFDRDLPQDLNGDSTIEHLMVRGEEAHLFYRQNPEGSLRHGVSIRAGQSWRTASPEAFDAILADTWLSGRPVIAGIHGDGASLILLRFQDDAWSVQSTARDALAPFAGNAEISVGFAGPLMTLIGASSNGDTMLTKWSATTGLRTSEPRKLDELTALHQPSIDQSTVTAIHMILLFSVLSAVFVMRRDRMFAATELQDGVAIAGIGQRIVALVIDLLLAFPIWGPLLNGIWGGESLSKSIQLFSQSRAQGLTAEVFWSAMIVSGASAIYGACFESIIATTPGKRLMGLTVICESGDRCRVRHALIRNLLRLIEYQLLPLAIFVFITPSRQRVGDLMARTIVVRSTGLNKVDAQEDQTEEKNKDTPADD